MKYSLILLHNNEAWCYPEERPELSKIKIETDSEGKGVFSQDSGMYHSEYDFKINLSEWEASKEVLQFAPGHYEKLMDRTLYPSLITPQIPIDITPFVEVRGGLMYFKEQDEESPYQKLFNHMSEEHGLILLESEMSEIINIVDEMQEENTFQTLLNQILKGEHEIIEGGLRQSVIDKDHVLKVFEALGIKENKGGF